MSAPPTRRSTFRDDIQGMRALAVLGILVFHLELSPYSGGFVTLDVFFVLSGFLITTLLLREIDRTGSVNLLAFYSRRARRILPAATTTIVGTVVASYLWLTPIDARDASLDGVWAALFGANIRFALEKTDYFAQGEPSSPLQHFWSLSVEEQFYLVLPALLLVTVLAALAARRRGAAPGTADEDARTPVRAIAVVLAAVCLASFAWSIHASAASPNSAYFSTLTRTWEFGAGALLALVAPAVATRLGDASRNLAALGGLALIAVGLFTVSEADAYPGWLALLPVTGTGAVLLAGTAVTADRPPLVPRLIGTRPLRVIGDASYSLYLWHWPVLVIARQHVERELRPVEIGVVLVVTTVMTWASYRFVETPFRRRTVRLRGGLVLYPVALALAVAGSLSGVAAVDRTLDRSNPAIDVDDYDHAPGGGTLSDDPAVALVQASVMAARRGAPVPGDLRPSLTELKGDTADMGRCDYEKPPWRLCRRGDRDAERTVVVLGNSHGRAWIPAFEKITKEAGYAAYYVVKPQCSSAYVHTVQKGEDHPWRDCDDFNRWAAERIQRLHPDLLVVSTTGSPRIWLDGEVVTDTERLFPALRRGFRDLFRKVTPYAERTALLVDVPGRETRPAKCLGNRGATLRDCLDAPSRRKEEIDRLSMRAARRSGVEVVPTKQWLCADGRCPAVVGDMVTMRDTGHLTTVYSRHLSRPLARALRLRRH